MRPPPMREHQRLAGAAYVSVVRCGRQLSTTRRRRLPGLRTRTSRTYLVNGEYQAELYGSSVNYQDSAGNWQPIDNSLVASTVPSYA